MNEVDIFTKFVDVSLTVAMLWWVISLGDKRAKERETDYRQQIQVLIAAHNESMQLIVKTLQEQNKALQDNLISCISALTSPEKR